MFDHKHYVPVIKSKAGELWALRHLGDSAKAMMTPLVEVLPHKTLGTAIQSGRICESLAEGWGTAGRLFIDTLHLGTQTSSDAASLTQYHTAARRNNLRAVPVTSIGRSQAYQQAIERIITADEQGAVFRLGINDFVDPDILRSSLGSLLNLLKLRPTKVDIVIDYGARNNEAELIQLSRLHLMDLPQIASWRTITIAAGSFPASLMHLNQTHWHQVQRHEWRAWMSTLTRRTPPPRLPAYGDYGVRDPGAPAEFGTPSANLRYASDEYWVVRRGRLVKQGGAADMPSICRSLMEMREWCQAPFSSGDHEIARIAASSDSTGNATQWVQWCMNHHFEFVVDQIRNHREL